MTKMFFSTLLMFFSILMFYLNHPLSMGLMILLQTLLTCILSGMMIKTYWFSYILFLTFLGGLLILFIYVSSIASNELFYFTFKMKISLFGLILLSIFFSVTFFHNLYWMNFFSGSSDMSNFFNLFFFFNNDNKINLSKLYNTQTIFLMIMLIIYLFITLIAVVKITNIFFGPLRSSI